MSARYQRGFLCVYWMRIILRLLFVLSRLLYHRSRMPEVGFPIQEWVHKGLRTALAFSQLHELPRPSKNRGIIFHSTGPRKHVFLFCVLCSLRSSFDTPLIIVRCPSARSTKRYYRAAEPVCVCVRLGVTLAPPPRRGFIIGWDLHYGGGFTQDCFILEEWFSS